MLGAAEGMGAKFTVDNSVPKEKFDQFIVKIKIPEVVLSSTSTDTLP